MLLADRQLGPGNAERLVFACEFQDEQVSTAFLQLPAAHVENDDMTGITVVSPDLVASAPRPIDPVADKAALHRKFPANLASGRISGEAVVLARVQTDGSFAPMRLLHTTDEQLGRACIEHVRELHWLPARDRLGRAVASEIRYTCKLTIRRLPYTTI